MVGTRQEDRIAATGSRRSATSRSAFGNSGKDPYRGSGLPGSRSPPTPAHPAFPPLCEALTLFAR